MEKNRIWYIEKPKFEETKKKAANARIWQTAQWRYVNDRRFFFL
jgi:hypothetical protein